MYDNTGLLSGREYRYWVRACKPGGVLGVLGERHRRGATYSQQPEMSEQMWAPRTNGPHTAHTTNPVGIILVGGKDLRKG